MKDAPASGSGDPNLRWLRSIPSGTLRLVFRLPIYLYHLNLGWLLGHRGILLIHRGRKSQLLRETVLEVARYDPATKELLRRQLPRRARRGAAPTRREQPREADARG